METNQPHPISPALPMAAIAVVFCVALSVAIARLLGAGQDLRLTLTGVAAGLAGAAAVNLGVVAARSRPH